MPDERPAVGHCIMAYDEDLAHRLRACLSGEAGVTEMRMFGGLAFMINRNMAVSASNQGGLLLRVDPADTAMLVNDPNADHFQMRGRDMRGWLRIDPGGLRTDRELAEWVARGVAYARSLPPKRR